LLACVIAATAAAQEPHWAFVAPVRPPVPQCRDAGWARNEVDHFVQAQHEAMGFTPSPEASRGELLRRAAFDLTGLPPSLAELERFERDERPDAFERVVDAMLASRAAAEESTRWWLDLSRYADTHGMQRDQVRALWRWRDWVLDAYAANMPFDRFVTEQFAGDLLPGATQAQRIASGWNRNNPTSDEGGLIPEEYLARYAMNRTDTFGTAMLGLTVGCAQCHDHKYDPLTQRDYYRLLAYFASFDEEGNDGGALAPAPMLLAPTPEQLVEQERLRAAATAAHDAFAAVAWTAAALAPADGAAFVAHHDGSLCASGPAPERGDYEFTATGDFGGAVALRLTALPDDALPERGPGRADNGNFVLSEVEVFTGEGDASARVPFASADADFAQPGFDAARAIDGDPATGWALSGRHVATALHLAFAAPLPAGTRTLRLVLRHQSVHQRHLLGRFAVHVTSADLATRLPALRASARELAEFEVKLPALHDERRTRGAAAGARAGARPLRPAGRTRRARRAGVPAAAARRRAEGSPRAGGVVVREGTAADRARRREPDLAAALRPRSRRNTARLRGARRAAESSGAARLARVRAHRARLGRTLAAPAARDVGDVPAVVALDAGAARRRSRQRLAREDEPRAAAGRGAPRPGARRRRPPGRARRRSQREDPAAAGHLGGDRAGRQQHRTLRRRRRRRPAPPQSLHVLEAHRRTAVAAHVRRAEP
jgi:hypothetical protein